MSPKPFSDTTLPIRNPLKTISSSPTALTDGDGPLEASKDARWILRLAQCPQCSRPLEEPATLPCGNSLCKGCIPQLHLRQNISYPATPNRLQGFTCPFKNCGLDHAIGDCSVDVVLNKITSLVRKEMWERRRRDEAGKVLLQLEEKDKISQVGMHNLKDREVRTRMLGGGRLVSTWSMAEMGELEYDSDVTYTTLLEDGTTAETLDENMLDHLQTITRSELDCQVCYQILLDPFTTSCGHTFCRTCLHRVLDHSNLCPVCRRQQVIPPALTSERAPSNRLIGKLLKAFCPEALAARKEIAKHEEKSGNGEMDVPLFVCTLSFPAVPTFLHVFEPRYRLMIRRAMESGDRKFGMVMHNPERTAQGDLGHVNFYQYGTLLHIINMHVMPDGRSLIETIGVSRFRVLKSATKDLYTIGKIERIDDMTMGAEEALEAEETASENDIGRNSSAQDHFGAPPHHVPPPGVRIPGPLINFDTMPTQALFEYSHSFIKRMREQSAPWLHHRVFSVYGECPNDPALFPWWFASALPMDDSEKYHLLEMTSVRRRLQVCARWVEGIEIRSRYFGLGV